MKNEEKQILTVYAIALYEEFNLENGKVVSVGSGSTPVEIIFNIKDDLVELFSKQKKNFCVEYKNGKVVCIEKKSKNLNIKKNSVGYTLSINNKIISLVSICLPQNDILIRSENVNR